MLCNFPSSGPMDHDHVVTFFHEFGHLMHHVLGGQNKSFVGFSGVATEWDFVEVPSQLNEEWAWAPDVLQRFAGRPARDADEQQQQQQQQQGGGGGVEVARRNETAVEVIPVELVARMKTADALGRALLTRQQVFYATLSLELHANAFRFQRAADVPALRWEAAEEDWCAVAGGEPVEDVGVVVAALQGRVSPYPRLNGTAFEASFAHLIGYGSNYYTYLWSDVIVKDMAQALRSAGAGELLVPDALVVGRRFRDEVLAPGGEKDAVELVRAFLGRDASRLAFDEWLRDDPTMGS